MKLLKLPRYAFDKYADVVTLWVWVSIMAFTFLVSVIFLKIHWLWKITLISSVALFSLILVLLFHEVFILVTELKELIEKINGGKKNGK